MDGVEALLYAEFWKSTELYEPLANEAVEAAPLLPKLLALCLNDLYK